MMNYGPSQRDLDVRLKALRAEMARQGLSGFIVPRQDEFQGEYVASYAERLRFLTGFAGSWGTAIVLKNKAAIFVDGRYTTQVRAQVKSKAFAFMHLIDQPPAQWLKANVKRGDKIGFDPMLHTMAEAARYAKAANESGAKLVAVKHNLVDAIWADQPARAAEALFVQPDRFAGKRAAAKLKDIAAGLRKAKVDAVVLAEPSSVAWLFNLRGRDVPFTPVVLAFAIVHANGKAELFIEDERLPPDVKRALKGLASIQAPSALAARLRLLKRKHVQLDEHSAPEFIHATLASVKALIKVAQDPCTLPKACKNKVEQQGARDAQKRDGAALTRFLQWLEGEAPKGKLREADAAAKLHEFRRETGVLVDLSFETIPASGPNAASPHYHVPADGGRTLRRNEIFLIDSGGQYRDGTTDVTRTVIIGTPTAEMKDRFTRVLKGMIAICISRFPQGTTGAHLDAFARNALWQAGLDFDHGTGHGIGSFLSVHEGPARISKASHVVLQPGMILSDEPGYYKPGHFGIRIENLLLVTAPEKIKGGERAMLGFETLTLAPIDRRLIDTTVMTRDELRWLDHYHARVLREIGPLVPRAMQAWLKGACAPLPRA